MLSDTEARAMRAVAPFGPGVMPELSVVVPVLNEQDVIALFLGRIRPILEGIDPNHEIVFVNDGSTDATLAVLREENRRDPRIRIVDLSRNFGKEIALSAGIDATSGRAVVPIDVDLQDPPDLIPEMVRIWRSGYDMVLARRVDRSTDSFMKRTTSKVFYKLITRMSDTTIPENVGDYRLMDRRVVDALKLLPERTRFMKGLFAWLGYRQATIDYSRPGRAAGTTKWRPLGLWKLAIEGIVSFSTLPLKLWSYIGVACASLGLAYGLVVIARALIWGNPVAGYASLVTFLLFFNGVTLIGLGVIGEYISRIFVEVKMRPLYLVREYVGSASSEPVASRPHEGDLAAAQAPVSEASR